MINYLKSGISQDTWNYSTKIFIVKMDLGLRLSSENNYRKKRILNSQAPVTPELATRVVSN